MNKLLPFALALALALPGCAAGDTAPQPPETPTTTTETAAEAPAESTLPGLDQRLHHNCNRHRGQHPAESGRAGDPGLLYQSGRLAGRPGTVH